jgi:transposase InsO family protein
MIAKWGISLKSISNNNSDSITYWLRENERELNLELDKWVEYYNRSYLHSAHGYRTPIQVEEGYYKYHDSYKNAA